MIDDNTYDKVLKHIRELKEDNIKLREEIKDIHWTLKRRCILYLLVFLLSIFNGFVIGRILSMFLQENKRYGNFQKKAFMVISMQGM